ncbi:hypothetical protein [Bradyrhizobium sp. CCBAU 45384]|uniref:hypothetical protein n=1 Tax=Bradyrhizobium sp. CCBAU 45384 TaxID=858428 RepID=UPI0023067F59|nr:hypothetical protein [Bradyrhizobium sp. CCBAU 45384]
MGRPAESGERQIRTAWAVKSGDRDKGADAQVALEMFAANEKGICRARREAMETQLKQLITRRELGDIFVLYPSQLALTTTPKYVGLPADVHADVLTRSSYPDWEST